MLFASTGLYRSGYGDDVKTCTRCGEAKPLDQFRHQKDRNLPRANCRACDTVRHRGWRETNRERVRAYDNARWRSASDRWPQHLRAKYGITPEDHARMLAEQNGGCAICGVTEPGGSAKRFPVDHCHATGAVRGLLCSRCNRLLGAACDKIETLQAAIAYLSRGVVSCS